MLIDNQIDQQTSTIRLKARFPNDDSRLWPGEFVRIRAQIDARQQVVTIPPPALQRGPNGLYAWVIKPDNTAEQRNLDATMVDGDTVIVSRGLNAGENVVVSGQYRLQAGTRVEAKTGTAKRRRDVRRCLMNISEPFIRRPIATALLSAALALHRHRDVPAAADRAAAAGRLPDDLGLGAACPARARTRWRRRSRRRSSASSARSPASRR